MRRAEKNNAQVLRSGDGIIYGMETLGKVTHVLMCSDVILEAVCPHQALLVCSLQLDVPGIRNGEDTVLTKENVPSANCGSYINPGDVRTQS